MTPRYKLRTLLILLAILPPLLWLGWTKYEAWRAEQSRLKALEAERAAVSRGQYGRQRARRLRSVPGEIDYQFPPEAQ